jgi:hypothetical protein
MRPRVDLLSAGRYLQYCTVQYERTVRQPQTSSQRKIAPTNEIDHYSLDSYIAVRTARTRSVLITVVILT